MTIRVNINLSRLALPDEPGDRMTKGSEMNAHNPYEFRPQSRGATRQDPRPQQHGTPPKTVSSDALFEGLYEIGIHHAGALYRLKITRQGKLILNK